MGANILILGFTFKENCPDVRNTKVVDIVKALKEYNLNITIYDPWANPEIAKEEYGIEIINVLPKARYHALVLAVAHDEFLELNINSLLLDNYVIYDVKGIYDPAIIDGRL